MVEFPLALILLEAELLTAATLGMDCLAHLLALALPAAAGLDLILPVKVSHTVNYLSFIT